MHSDSQQIGAAQIEAVLSEAGIERVPVLAPARHAAQQPGRLRPLGEQVADLEREAIRAAMARPKRRFRRARPTGSAHRTSAAKRASRRSPSSCVSLAKSGKQGKPSSAALCSQRSGFQGCCASRDWAARRTFSQTVKGAKMLVFW